MVFIVAIEFKLNIMSHKQSEFFFGKQECSLNKTKVYYYTYININSNTAHWIHEKNQNNLEILL